MVEELFGPSRHNARIVIEQQRSDARLAPAPADPPDLPGPVPFVKVEEPAVPDERNSR
jgi:hypothetical protein